LRRAVLDILLWFEQWFSHNATSSFER